MVHVLYTYYMMCTHSVCLMQSAIISLIIHGAVHSILYLSVHHVHVYVYTFCLTRLYVELWAMAG